MKTKTTKAVDPQTITRLGKVTEVAAHLAVSRSTVYELMNDGRLPYVTIGHSRRIRWSDVERLVSEGTVGA